MADLSEVLGPVSAEPDLSDLKMVIVNVETQSGEQFAIVMDCEEGKRLELTTQSTERGDLTLHSFGVQHGPRK